MQVVAISNIFHSHNTHLENGVLTNSKEKNAQRLLLLKLTISAV